MALATVGQRVSAQTDLDAFIRNKDIRKEFYGRSFPAATWVEVRRLYLPSFVVEIELTAKNLK